MKSLFIFYLLIILTNSENISGNDINQCSKINNQDTCISTSLQLQNQQCCFIEGKGCLNITNSYFDIFSNSRLKAIQKEIKGFDYTLKDNFSSDINIINGKCKEGNINWSLEEQTYSEDDKKLLKSDDYCLNYHNKVIQSQTIITKENCLNAKIMSSSEKEGVECAFYEITIITDGIGEKTIKTCHLLNPDIIDSSLIDEGTKEIFKTIVTELSAVKRYSSYKMDIYTSEGDSIRYDSSKNELTEIPKNSSRIIYAYKFLFFIFFILI